eukprot:907584_1
MRSNICLNAARIIRCSVIKHNRRPITTASQPAGNFKTDISAYSSISHAVTPLNSYGLLKITGRDALTFLQGLVTNDITNPSHPNTYNAILAPSGRYLFDCFISQSNDDFLLETDINHIPSLIQTFKKYKLRAKVKFENMSDTFRVWSVLTPPKSVHTTYQQLVDQYPQHRCYIDPRYDALGIRIVLNQSEIPHLLSDSFVPIGEDFYYTLKCIYGIATHDIDLISDKSIILESNFNYLNGVSFTKGCYVGQELMARTQHRGQIRKRLFGATIVDKTDTSVKYINNKEDDRDTIFPMDQVDINTTKYDYDSRNIIDINSKKVVGKVTSQATDLNCCVAQLRNTAFIDSNTPTTVGLQIQDTEYHVIPHYTDYFTSFGELFGKE